MNDLLEVALHFNAEEDPERLATFKNIVKYVEQDGVISLVIGKDEYYLASVHRMNELYIKGKVNTFGRSFIRAYNIKLMKGEF